MERKGGYSFREIENSLKECNCIKYAAYRTAAKFRLIQKELFMDKVQLRVISNIFEKHQLQQTENSVLLDPNELQSVLFDIYFATEKENGVSLNLDRVTELMIIFLFNIYDRKIKSVIQVLSLKVCLTLFCEAKPREKYHYLFEQMADHNNCLSRKKLEILLKKMVRVTEYIGEGLSFGLELIAGTVESCFQANIGTVGISEDVFVNWLTQDPQLLVWLSTFYRMQISESVSHNAKCGVCKVYPVIGLRYRCLRCLSYDMCQWCFFTGRINKKHKLQHPVQEYCCPMTSQQSTKAFLLTLKNKLYKKERKLQYLPALRVESKEFSQGQNTRLLDEMDISSKTLINGSRVSWHKCPQKELDSIIVHLEKESESLLPQIEDLFSGLNVSDMNYYQHQVKNMLLKHKNQVKSQVQKLKIMKNYYTTDGMIGRKTFLASTPMVEELLLKNQKRVLNNDLENFSPILSPKISRPTHSGSNKKMMWDNYDLANCSAEATWEEIKSSRQKKNASEVFSYEAKEEEKEDVSTWLGGEVLQEVDYSSRDGFTWLGDNTSERKSDEEAVGEKFEELQNDLKIILKKLQEISMSASKPEGDERGEASCYVDDKIQTAIEMDTLLVDLINGIEKLVGD